MLDIIRLLWYPIINETTIDMTKGSRLGKPTSSERSTSMANLPTVAQTANAINGVRATGTEADVNAFLCAIERHYGAEHMKAAHALASDLPTERSEEVQDGIHCCATCGALLHCNCDDDAYAQPAYKLFGREVGEWHGGMYRFYCYLAAWPYSPAARDGAALC